MDNYQIFQWDWVRVVLVWSMIIFAVSTPILVFGIKLVKPQALGRLSNRLRWVLVIPFAFVLGTVAELLPRFLFAIYEISINHTLTFKPGFDSLVWAAYAPLFFVIGGILMAPSHKFATLFILGGFKIFVALFNLYNIIAFTRSGSGWSLRDPLTNSPLWWNAPVYVIGISLIMVFGAFMAIRRSSWLRLNIGKK